MLVVTSNNGKLIIQLEWPYMDVTLGFQLSLDWTVCNQLQQE